MPLAYAFTGKAALMHNKPQSTLHARSRSIASAIILIATFAVSATAATFTVTSTADSGGSCPGANCTLRDAIAAANGGDTINFSLPPNSFILLTSGELLINKDLTIEGPGALQLSIQRSGDTGVPPFRIFEGYRNLTISGLTIAFGRLTSSGGLAQRGGGIYYDGVETTLTISKCLLYGNYARDEGGGIWCGQGKAIITDSAIVANDAGGAGTIGDGGGVYVGNLGDVTITNTTIGKNLAGRRGAGIYNFLGKVLLTNSTVAENETVGANAGDGGGVYNDSSGSTSGVFTVRNTIIAKNIVPSSATAVDFRGSLTSQGYVLIAKPQGCTISGTTTGNQLTVDPHSDRSKSMADRLLPMR